MKLTVYDIQPMFLNRLPRMCGLSLLRSISVLVLLALLVGCRLDVLRFKAIYVDLDGTALGKDGNVRNATVDALHWFKRMGGRVGIATGRTREQAERAIREIEPNLPIILANGAQVVDYITGKSIVDYSLESESARSTLMAVSGRDSVLGVVAHFERANYATAPERLAAFAARSRISLQPRALTEADLVDTVGHGRILKLLIVVMAPPEDFKPDCPCATRTWTLPDRVRDEIGLKVRKAHLVASGAETVEVAPVSKGQAVLEALRLVGVRPDDVLAFGDSGNDVELLRSVGLGVAMSNCRSGACEAALARIGENDTDAIAEFVRRVAARSVAKK
jgi:5-amino-6-(5-phospho-D-ribitylamino)uracil phosphatase